MNRQWTLVRNATPLIRSLGSSDSVLRRSMRTDLILCVCLAAITLMTFAPTLRNGFLPLGFDDALISDTPALHALSWANLWALATSFNQAHYVPLTMLSLAIDYHFWGLTPFGYHLTNILLHATTAVLVYIFLLPLVRSVSIAFWAAVLFAVHPIQLEAVSVAVQRKSVLSGALFFLTLIAYQRWCDDRRWRSYTLCLLAFAAAAASKPAVVTLPLVLLLYDVTFVGGRIRLHEKMPFFAISAISVMTTMAAHHAVGAYYPLHGGTVLSHFLVVSRMACEQILALILPLTLAPIYYYPRSEIYTLTNYMAMVLIPGGGVLLILRRKEWPWTFFCMGWFMLVLLPESNFVPLAQLRADRFLYLASLGLALWISVGLAKLARSERRGTWGMLPPHLIGGVIAVSFIVISVRSAGIWHDDLTAWQRVVTRQPWCGVAHDMLGRAMYEVSDYTQAEREFSAATRLHAPLPEPHLYLAKLYARRGRDELAEVEVRRYLELKPQSTDGQQLLAALQHANDS